MAAARVLLVDDDAVLVDMVTRYLHRDGYLVEWLADGSSVPQAIATNPPDLVILDLLLPGRHGREVCRDVRRTSSVPILMLTALGDEPDRIAGFEVGADDYLTKPFSLRELVLRGCARSCGGPNRPKTATPVARCCATATSSSTRAAPTSAWAASS